MGEAIDRIHVPVMRTEILDAFAPVLTGQPGGQPDQQPAPFVDCTLGIGGHTAAILAAYPNARAIGIDRDPHALALAQTRLAQFSDRVTFAAGVFADLADFIDGPVAAILADLGLSSLQIDQPERGFSYSISAPLDMRMDPGLPVTAADIVNDYPPERLAEIFRNYGEERFAHRVANAIAKARTASAITSSDQLATLIANAIPKATQSHGHPAKRCFQALRIEVNQELELLDRLLPAGLAALEPGGRFAVLSYHSLEDRRVKQAFRDASTDRAPRNLPVVPPEYRAQYRLVTRGAQRPTETECETNPRAASARLRVVERRTA